MDENFRHERVKQDLTVKSCLKSYSKRFNIFFKEAIVKIVKTTRNKIPMMES